MGLGGGSRAAQSMANSSLNIARHNSSLVAISRHVCETAAAARRVPESKYEIIVGTVSSIIFSVFDQNIATCVVNSFGYVKKSNGTMIRQVLVSSSILIYLWSREWQLDFLLRHTDKPNMLKIPTATYRPHWLSSSLYRISYPFGL